VTLAKKKVHNDYMSCRTAAIGLGRFVLLVILAALKGCTVSIEQLGAQTARHQHLAAGVTHMFTAETVNAPLFVFVLVEVCVDQKSGQLFW
jgi:hypothetical protein